jgi:uncharacterized protein (DUF305 family)
MRGTLAIVTLLLIAGCGTTSATPPPAPVVATVVATVDAAHNAADTAFVRAMIDNHRTGIMLASAAARRPEAHTLAEAIISTQQDEIVRMTGWLKTWGVPAPPSGAPSVGVSGDAVRELIAHQQAAVALAQREQSPGSNRTALDFAKQVVESRTAEADELRRYSD